MAVAHSCPCEVIYLFSVV